MPNATDTKLELDSHTYVYRVAIPYRPTIPTQRTTRHAKIQVQSAYFATSDEITAPIDISNLKQWDTSQFFNIAPASSATTYEITEPSWQTSETATLTQDSTPQVEVNASLVKAPSTNLIQTSEIDTFLPQANIIRPERFCLRHPYLTWSTISALSIGLFFTFMQLWTWEEAGTIVIFTSLLCFLLGITFMLRILQHMHWRYIAFSVIWSGLITYGSWGIAAGFNA